MMTAATLVASVLFLIPVFSLFAAKARRDRELWEIALDIPFAVAIDLLSVLLLSKFVPLQIAALVSRPLWIAAAALVMLRRKRKGDAPSWPSALGAAELWIVALCSFAAILLSLQLSRPYAIWDRFWHIPLVSSMRGQTNPFFNVYEPTVKLYYHFSGNALAAMLQALSFAVVHASFALSIAHDIMFGLTGACLALLFRAWGLRRSLIVALAVLGVLLIGPPTVLRAGEGRPEGGYSYLNFLVMSYRPHVSVAALLLVGFAGAILVRLRGKNSAVSIPLSKTAPVLIGCTALLGITDEASIGTVGLALGLTWLAVPDVVAPKRLSGILIFLGLALALALPNVLLSAALSPGAHSLDVGIVPWRSPGYHNPVLPLSTEAGRWMLFLDLLPMIAVLFAGLLRLRKRRDQAMVGSVLLYGVLLLISALLLTRIEIDHSPYEAHRFMTAISLLTPVFGLSWIGPFSQNEGRSTRPATLGPVLVLVAIGLCAVPTLEWIQGVAPKRAHKHEVHDKRRNLFTINCRKATGATLLDRPKPVYMAPSIWYLYAGCRPVFSIPTPSGHWTMKIGPPKLSEGALSDLHRGMVKADEMLEVLCPAKTSELDEDKVCEYAMAKTRCESIGSLVVRCELTGAQRLELMAALGTGAAKKPAKP